MQLVLSPGNTEIIRSEAGATVIETRHQGQSVRFFPSQRILDEIAQRFPDGRSLRVAGLPFGHCWTPRVMHIVGVHVFPSACDANIATTV